MRPPQKQQRIAMLMDMNHYYNRTVAAGVRKYFRTHGPGVCEGLDPTDGGPWEWLLDGEWDGILTYTYDESLIAFLEKHRIPAVNVSNSLPPGDKVPRVVSDDYAVGRMAAEHFLESGLRHFAFFGNDAHVASLRKKGYGDRLKAAGFTYEELWPHFQLVKGRSMRTELPGMEERVAGGAWPLGVFCVNDVYARFVVGCCAAHGIGMPGQVAIVGVNNSEVADGLAEIPFSSIELQLEHIGYRAMELLTRMLGGLKPPREPLLILPKQLVVRLSSDLMAVNDEAVARALRIIRENALRPIEIEEIVDQVGISRRLLEKRFKAAKIRSPYAEVLRLRVEKAKSLLAGTDWLVADIAEASGFSQSKQLHAIFTRETGMPPSVYRLQFQTRRPGAGPGGA